MGTAKRARIQDIAEKVGVSMMTVSRVLNQDARVSDSTRAKVLEAAKTLNYRPNVSARRLASNKSFFIGLLYSNPSETYVSQFLLGALKRCRATGQHLIVDESDEQLEKTLATVTELIEVTKVDGIILLPPLSDLPEVVDLILQSDVPLVRIAPDSKLHCSPYVCMDDYQAAFDVTEMLIQQGHTRIAHIIGHPNQGASRLRYQGYLDALRSNQLNVPPEYIEQGYFDYKSGLEATAKLLDLPQPPTAIFAGNDDMAAAALSAANTRRISVPDQLSLVGFDDTILATSVWPHLTTVRQPISEMAETAISMLASGKFDDLSKVKSSDFRNILDFEIIRRDSDGPIAKT